MLDAGIDGLLDDVLALLRPVVGEVDVEALDVTVAARVVEQCAEAERLLAALRVLVGSSLKDKGFWRRDGFRSVAAWMAARTGSAVGPAIESLEMAGQLGDLPLLAEAFRSG